MAIARYVNTGTGLYLDGWYLNSVCNLTINEIPAIYSTGPISPAKQHIRRSDLRFLNAGQSFPNLVEFEPSAIAWPWQSHFGVPPPTGTVAFGVRVINRLTGYATKMQIAFSSWANSTIAPYLNVNMDGTPIAQLTDTTVSVNGTVIATS